MWMAVKLMRGPVAVRGFRVYVCGCVAELEQNTHLKDATQNPLKTQPVYLHLEAVSHWQHLAKCVVSGWSFSALEIYFNNTFKKHPHPQLFIIKNTYRTRRERPIYLTD